MIPRVKKDYEQSLEELDDLLVVLESDASVQSSSMFEKAKELLDEKKWSLVCSYAFMMFLKLSKLLETYISSICLE